MSACCLTTSDCRRTYLGNSNIMPSALSVSSSTHCLIFGINLSVHLPPLGALVPKMSANSQEYRFSPHLLQSRCHFSVHSLAFPTNDNNRNNSHNNWDRTVCRSNFMAALLCNSANLFWYAQKTFWYPVLENFALKSGLSPTSSKIG